MKCSLRFERLLVPVKEFLDSVLDFDLVGPAEGVEFLHVDELAHGAIRLASIEFYGALKAYGLDNEFREFTDGEFLAGTYINMAVANLTE